MVFNLNVVDLTLLLFHEINNTLYEIFFIIPLNHLQFHYVQISSDKNYNFYNFLSVQ